MSSSVDGASLMISALMCAPTHYTVRYSINPWMDPGRAVDSARADQQWRALVSALGRQGVDIQLIDQDPYQPDMVFTANAGLVHGRRVVLSRFACRERRGEEPMFAGWFACRGYEVLEVGEPFEGAGDAFVFGDQVIAGWGWRSTRAGVEAAAALLGLRCVPLRLTDPRFYHLDTCLSILDPNTILWYPGAFDCDAGRALETLGARLIPIAEPEALQFACNAVTSGRAVYTTGASPRLRRSLGAAGFDLHGLTLDEFLKAGGGARCLTLPLETLAWD